MNKNNLGLKDLYDPTKVDAAMREKYEAESLDLTNAMLFMRGCKCLPDKKMIKGLESEYVHGNKDAYPEKLYGMLKLYRKQYALPPKKKIPHPDMLAFACT